jgi:hypothetical protein
MQASLTFQHIHSTTHSCLATLLAWLAAGWLDHSPECMYLLPSSMHSALMFTLLETNGTSFTNAHL